MRIRSNIRAGNEAAALRKCQQERDYWKAEAERMEAIATSPTAPAQPTTPTSTTTTVSCGYVNGVYYPDMSGTCAA
jgi:hypothetical protein